MKSPTSRHDTSRPLSRLLARGSPDSHQDSPVLFTDKYFDVPGELGIKIALSETWMHPGSHARRGNPRLDALRRGTETVDDCATPARRACKTPVPTPSAIYYQ